MDKAELLVAFTERVDQFERYQGFIDKARSQQGKFAPAVVEKVISDNEQKSMEIVSEIVPLMSDMEQVIGGIDAQRTEALDSAKDSQFKLEELELRLAIGDLSDEDFQQESMDFKSTVDSTDARVSELDQDAEEFREALGRWSELGTAAGVLQSIPEQPDEVIDAEPDAEFDASQLFEEEAPVAEPDPVSDEHEPIEALEAPSDLDSHDGPIEIEAAEADPIDHAEADAEVVFEEAANEDGFEVDDLDLLGDDEEIELDGGAREDKDKPRRAVLLYQEGTAEEQIYPFTGEVMSLGRGRDNDVQVKNDSKVSRYHCKLYRRGPNFYIEDNKSANGTLVNGELITERRLFGGEEVIIGETFFRFRILD